MGTLDYCDRVAAGHRDTIEFVGRITARGPSQGLAPKPQVPLGTRPPQRER